MLFKKKKNQVSVATSNIFWQLFGHLVEVLISVVNINKCMSQILFGKVAKWPGCVWQAWVVWILLMLMLKVAADFFFFFKGSEEISPQLKASIIKADVFSVFTL